MVPAYSNIIAFPAAAVAADPNMIALAGDVIAPPPRDLAVEADALVEGDPNLVPLAAAAKEENEAIQDLNLAPNPVDPNMIAAARDAIAPPPADLAIEADAVVEGDLDLIPLAAAAKEENGAIPNLNLTPNPANPNMIGATEDAIAPLPTDLAVEANAFIEGDPNLILLVAIAKEENRAILDLNLAPNSATAAGDAIAPPPTDLAIEADALVEGDPNLVPLAAVAKENKAIIAPFAAD